MIIHPNGPLGACGASAEISAAIVTVPLALRTNSTVAESDRADAVARTSQFVSSVHGAAVLVAAARARNRAAHRATATMQGKRRTARDVGLCGTDGRTKQKNEKNRKKEIYLRASIFRAWLGVAKGKRLLRWRRSSRRRSRGGGWWRRNAALGRSSLNSLSRSSLNSLSSRSSSNRSRSRGSFQECRIRWLLVALCVKDGQRVVNRGGGSLLASCALGWVSSTITFGLACRRSIGAGATRTLRASTRLGSRAVAATWLLLAFSSRLALRTCNGTRVAWLGILGRTGRGGSSSLWSRC